MGQRTGNLRDLGGLITRDGRTVRAGTLLRSEALGTLDGESRRWLAAVPVKLIFDLRSSREGQLTDLWNDGAKPEVVPIELFPLTRINSGDLVAGLLDDDTGAYARAYMAAFYRDMVDVFPDRCLPEFAHWVGAEGQVPVLIHCTAGQDRTGFLTALVLLALGVPRHMVVADYARSADHFGLDRILAWVLEVIGTGDERVPTISALAPLSALPEYLEMALALIDERYGSVERYWSDAAGIGADGLAQVRKALLD